MTERKGSLWVVFCLFAVLLVPLPASADPVTVTGGFLFMNPSFGPIELTGERGFSLSSRVDVSGGRFLPYETCSLPQCRPGTEVSLRGLWTGNDLTGRLTFDGQTYNDLGGLNSWTQASVEFLGFFNAPPIGPSAQLTAPFRLVGMFTVPDAAGISPVEHTLSGMGTATINLSRHQGAPADDPAWLVDSVRYDFAAAEPVPEPGTMLLVGLGIAGVARRVRQRRAKA